MAREREERIQKPAERPAAPEQSKSEEISPALLERVVAETTSQLAGPLEHDANLWPALLQVAERYAGQPMTLEPVGVALLESLLGPSFPVLAARPALLSKAARTVAQTLLADPAARRRLENLWHELSEGRP
jgi:hypothetical protein